MDLREFYLNFLNLTDRIIPSVSPTEVPILIAIFTRSIATGEKICSLSYRDFSLLANQSTPTIKKVLQSLKKRKLIRLSNTSSGRKAKTYEFLWPDPLPYMEHMKNLHRDPYLLISKIYGSVKIEGIIDNLTQEDKDLLDITIRDLNEEERSSLQHDAEMLVGQGNESEIEKAFKEIVLKKYFGRHRLSRYDVLKNGKQG